MVGLAVIFMASAALAAATRSEGFLSAEPLSAGSLVSADPNPGIIVPANVSNADRLVGIVLDPQNAIFTVRTKAGETQVATEGIVPAIVSTINGDIKVGDKITASPVGGVGMKVTTTAKIVGVAQASLDAKTGGVVKAKLKDTAGKEQETYVGQVPVLISINYFTKGEGEKPLVPSFLQKFANAVASKEVSQLPILIGLIIFLVTLLSSFVILYGTIRSSIVSIGRNPLSRKAIISGMIQVVFLVFALNVIGMASIYAVLKFV